MNKVKSQRNGRKGSDARKRQSVEWLEEGPFSVELLRKEHFEPSDYPSAERNHYVKLDIGILNHRTSRSVARIRWHRRNSSVGRQVIVRDFPGALSRVADFRPESCLSRCTFNVVRRYDSFSRVTRVEIAKEIGE